MRQIFPITPSYNTEIRILCLFHPNRLVVVLKNPVLGPFGYGYSVGILFVVSGHFIYHVSSVLVTEGYSLFRSPWLSIIHEIL
jgi:hypothetical protein